MENPAGSSGGSAEGASEGRQPLTGPLLPRAAQAAEIKRRKASVPAGHTQPRKESRSFPRLPDIHMTTSTTTFPQRQASNFAVTKPQASRHPKTDTQSKSALWHCAARREIARPEGGKLPKQKPRSPREMTEYGKPLKANPWEWRDMENPAGSSGGVQRGPRRGRSP